MRLGYGLNLEQTQKLIMTPELRQAIAILQLSAQELSTYVEQQLLENPLLEVVDEAENKEEPDIHDERPELTESAESPVETKWEVDWHEYFLDQEDKHYHGERQETERRNLDIYTTSAPTLQEHLMEQIYLQQTPVKPLLVEYIIGNLNEDGYLTLSLAEIARDQRANMEEAEKALAIVQSLDPLGVGARTLEECLRLQLPLIPDCPPEMNEFLRYLEDLACGRLQRIAQGLKISLNRAQELADLLRTLDPKPGRRYSGPGEVRYIIPDVVVEEVEGEYIIIVNDSSVPRLGINDAYRRVLTQAEGSEARKFVEQKLNSAAWLVRSIEQRRLTLYKVTAAIIQRQEDFIRQGIRHLKPLTLRDIAEEVGVHESTVSRATANKYVQTPRGIFDFKFFFAGSVGREEITPEVIKKALRDIIAAENPKNPYPDQQLSELLKERGMEISRRTVAKYRDELRLPPAAVRKRY